MMKISSALFGFMLVTSLTPAHSSQFLRGNSEPPASCLAVIFYPDSLTSGSATELVSSEEPVLACGTKDGLVYNIKRNTSDPRIKKLIKEGHIRSGETHIIIGERKPDAKGNIVFGEEEQIDYKNANGRPGGGRKLAIVEGEKSVLVVRVQASGSATTSTEDQLSSSVFGNGVDLVNLKSQYSACSKGKLSIVKAADRNLSATVDPLSNAATPIRNGVTTVQVASSSNDTDSVMRNDVTNALNQNFDVASPSELANYVMYCLPANTLANGWIAYAYLNSWNTIFSDLWCTSVSSQVHEIGHNFNLGHSNKGGTYEDKIGMMGFSFSNSDSPKMCFNGANYWQLGWLSSQGSTATGLFHVGTGGAVSYQMQGVVSDSWSNGYPKVVKINTSTATDYFVMFNLALSFNTGTQLAANQVTVVRHDNEGLEYSETELVAQLNASSIWALPIDGRTIAVKVKSISTSNGVNSLAVVCISDNGNTDCATTTTATTTAATTTAATTTAATTTLSSVCNKNGVCGGSETCKNCSDCRSKLTGSVSGRYCCVGSSSLVSTTLYGKLC